MPAPVSSLKMTRKRFYPAKTQRLIALIFPFSLISIIILLSYHFARLISKEVKLDLCDIQIYNCSCFSNTLRLKCARQRIIYFSLNYVEIIHGRDCYLSSLPCIVSTQQKHMHMFAYRLALF